MTPTQARQWTLKELFDWCDEEQTKCESPDNWVVIGNTCVELADKRHAFEIGTEVSVEKSPSDYWICQDATGKRDWVNVRDLENRNHLEVIRFNALESVKQKCNELMNSISVAA